MVVGQWERHPCWTGLSTRERSDALLVDLDPFLPSRRVRLVTLAARHASPQDSQNDI
jgi:hypothetical protein